MPAEDQAVTQSHESHRRTAHSPQLRETNLCHLGNLATRWRLDGEREKVLSDEAANGGLSRQYRKVHWAAPKV